MRLGQIKHDGRTVAAIFEGDIARPIPAHSLLELIRRAESESIALPALASSLASRHGEKAVPLIPIHPVEVWACGCTYETSPSFPDPDPPTPAAMQPPPYHS